jgi:signal transduction histidine kinase
MHLIRHTINQIGLMLIPITIIGGFFIYTAIKFISYEETDEYLTFEMNRIVKQYYLTNELPEINDVDEIIPNFESIVPFFKDTFIVDDSDGEEISYRELYFSLEHEGEVYGIVLRHLLLGRGDIARGSMYIIFGLMVLISITVLLMVNLITDRIWQPFFDTLKRIRSYNVQDTLPEFKATEIEEFSVLNSTILQMLKKMTGDYKRTKEFNENAAHELQTYLAVIKTSNEELLNTLPESSKWIEEARKSYASATKLSHIQKSLLLLSKIGNKEFYNNVYVPLDRVLEKSIEDFQEVIELLNINVTTEINRIKLLMDSGLATILTTNLVKNAVKHNINDGFIKIILNQNSLVISNSGESNKSNPSLLMERFEKGHSGNMGLGLAIVKQICDLYDFPLQYSIIGNNHEIFISFK